MSITTTRTTAAAAAAAATTTAENKAKYRALKRKLRFLIYEQECFQEELRRAQRKLLKISRDKSFLLDRLLQYERVEGSSSDSASTASSDSEKESKRVSEAKKQKKKAKPIKVKVKKRKQRQLKSLLSGDRKPLPGNLNYTTSCQQQQQQQPPPQPQQQAQLPHNPNLIDLMNIGSPNIHLSPTPLATLGLPMPSQDSLFSGVGLHGFTPTSSLGTQRPSKLSSLLASDSSAMNALMRAGLAAAAAGEKAEKQSRKKQKKDLDKLQTPLHPGIYPSSFSPPLSFQQSPALEIPSVGKSPPTCSSSNKAASLLVPDTADTRQGSAPVKTTPKAGVSMVTEEEGEDLIIDVPND